MCTTIQSRYRRQCGIVYCFSRNDCESVARGLSAQGIKAKAYHAGLDTAERASTQHDWSRGVIQVVVATIAFGMGINKPNVRFVMHHTMPKSMEGYYQESGRAGRDGAKADCILYYAYGDSKKLESMIERSETTAHQKAQNMETLKLVVKYCENKVDCRRSQVLCYFDEKFDPSMCGKTCDNCRSSTVYTVKDMTEVGVRCFALAASICVRVCVRACVRASVCACERMCVHMR